MDTWFGESFSTQEVRSEDAAMAFNVKIPTFLIEKAHSEELQKSIKNKEHVVLKTDLELPLTTDSKSVFINFFYASIFDLPIGLITDLYQYEHAFGEQAKFRPGIVTFACPSCPKSVKEEKCLSNGRYCFIPPNNNFYKMLPTNMKSVFTPRQHLLENLRQRCVFEVAE